MVVHCIEWRQLSVTRGELCIATVLRCGQSFRWKNVGDEWSCALSGRIVILKQDLTHLHYRAIFPSKAQDAERKDDTSEVLRDYFNLSVDLTKLYKQWSDSDPIFMKKAPKFTGIRMLRQDPWENLISFICSTNNNISRISQMVEKLCVNYGDKLGELAGVEYYDFPPPHKLATTGIEQRLRELGFGYRAKYIANTARIIANEKPPEWLHSLRKQPYREVHNALLELSGVGPKVADCVCLMSMDKAEAVPVDTHVWQIAMRDYKFGKGKLKSLTPATYWAIGDHFRELWGQEAGWAHSVLFTADLRAFSERVETKIKGIETTMKVKTTAAGQEITRLNSTVTAAAVKGVKRESMQLVSDTKTKLEVEKKEAISVVRRSKRTKR
ncbi:8-oxoguanine DNA glycosylase [Kalaharituber pfeilii]|nr:8-oxoguanine DNA glycosylase [Kalaharituber pfeilii]